MTYSQTACTLALGLFVTIAFGTAVQAQQSARETRPELLTRLIDCRTVVEAAPRLDCYDAAASALDSAEKQGDVVIIDRQQVGEARRQLFGFQLPAMPDLFQRGDQPDAINSIESSLARAGRYAEGKWTFTLADGSIWRQIDSETVRFQNRPGQPVRVRRAALGSYLLTVENSRAVRVRRQ